jgi:fido (protein-threonine AMPylation protein)
VILFDLSDSEANPAYQSMAISNGDRQIRFLQSAVIAAIESDHKFLSDTLLKALNFHAIACLHANAGQYRPCKVYVGDYVPPPEFQVPGLMENFINKVNRGWEEADPVVLASFILWRLNHIHPFINGNGRTARAAAYFALCVKLGGWLRGTPILPARLKTNNPEYIAAIKAADASLATGTLDLSALHGLISRLLAEQINGAEAPKSP